MKEVLPPSYVNTPVTVAYAEIDDALIVTITRILGLCWAYDYERTPTLTPEQLADLRTKTAASIDRIRDERDWLPDPGPLCDWCEFKEICPVFRKQETEEAQDADAPAGEAAPAKDQLRLI